jgi:hypothetical protein
VRIVVKGKKDKATLGRHFVCHPCAFGMGLDEREIVQRHLSLLSGRTYTLGVRRGVPPAAPKRASKPKPPARVAEPRDAPAKARPCPPALLELLGYGP